MLSRRIPYFLIFLLVFFFFFPVTSFAEERKETGTTLVVGETYLSNGFLCKSIEGIEHFRDIEVNSIKRKDTPAQAGELIKKELKENPSGCYKSFLELITFEKVLFKFDGWKNWQDEDSPKKTRWGIQMSPELGLGKRYMFTSRLIKKN